MTSAKVLKFNTDDIFNFVPSQSLDISAEKRALYAIFIYP